MQSIDYDHYGRCFECSKLTGLNPETLMCEKHDYKNHLKSLKARIQKRFEEETDEYVKGILYKILKNK